MIALALSLMRADDLPRLRLGDLAPPDRPAPQAAQGGSAAAYAPAQLQQPAPMQQAAPPQQAGPAANGARPSDYRVAFEVMARTPYAEIHFRGLSLKRARQNPGLNELALDFDQPVPNGVFDQLQQSLPEWVTFAYSGYDSAVIRAARPARFDTRPEADGFSLRITSMEPAQPEVAQRDTEIARLDADAGQPGVALRHLSTLEESDPDDPNVLRAHGAVEAGVGDWNAAQHYYEQALAERPHDEGLRKSLDDVKREAGPQVALSTDWRHVADGENVLSFSGGGRIPVLNGFFLTGQATDTRATGPAVLQINGTTAAVSTNMVSGAAGMLWQLAGGDEARLDALFSPAGPGGRAIFTMRWPYGQTEFTTQYHAPYLETAEAVNDKAVIDRVQARFDDRIIPGLWAELAGRATRYGVSDDSNLARTAGFNASLRWVQDVEGWSLGLAYEVNGEYVISRDDFVNSLGTHFSPLSIRNREVHDLALSASTPIFDDLWFDAYGGYAIDRFGGNGPFGGVSLRYTVAPGFDVTAGASYSSVPSHEGANEATTTAGVNLIYKMPYAGGLFGD
jgi:hypothetical protein